MQDIDDTMSDLRQTMRLLDAATPGYSASPVSRSWLPSQERRSIVRRCFARCWLMQRLLC